MIVSDIITATVVYRKKLYFNCLKGSSVVSPNEYRKNRLRYIHLLFIDCPNRITFQFQFCSFNMSVRNVKKYVPKIKTKAYIFCFSQKLILMKTLYSFIKLMKYEDSRKLSIH